MPKITEITYKNGHSFEATAFIGLHVSDTELARIEIIRYLQKVKKIGKGVIEIYSEDMNPGGSWENQDEVEMF